MRKGNYQEGLGTEAQSTPTCHVSHLGLPLDRQA